MRIIQWIVLTGLSGACSLPSLAQKDDMTGKPGRITDYSGKEGPPNLLNNNGLDDGSLKIMHAASLKMIGVAESCPDLRQPMGFDLHVQVSVGKPSPYCHPLQQTLTVNNWLAIHEYYKNESGGVEVNAETGAGIYLNVNQLLNLFPADFNKDCDEFKVPRFFVPGLFSAKEETEDFLLMQDGRRIITNGKPLFIPYSREQYLQFLIKKQEREVQNEKKAMQEFKAMKDRATAAANDQIAAGADKGIVTAGRAMEAAQQKLNALTGQLASLPAAEKKSPAYMVFSREAISADPSRFMALTTKDDKDGVEVFTPNPDYFAAGLSKASVQLITVVGRTDTRFVSKYYANVITRVMEGLNYKALKNMIQQ